MRVACIYPSIIKETVDYPGQFEPLGIQYIASTAISEQCETQIFIPYFKENLNAFIERIISFNPDIVAFSVMTCQLYDSIEILKEIKETKKSIISVAGGPHPTVKPDDLLENGFDVCVRGEGEVAFREILQRIKNNENPYKVSSITFCENGKVQSNPSGKRANLDDICWPTRMKSMLKPETYIGMAYPAPNIKGWASISTHRGCPFNCSFCDSSLIWNKKVTYRSVKNVIDEMVYLYENYDAELFHFTDLNFTSNKKYCLELCDEIIDSKKNFHWFCMANVNTTFDSEIVAAMKESGCTLVSIGIESINPQTLTKVNKEFNKKMFEVTDLLAQNGIPVNIFYMICFPWENSDTIMQDAEILYDMNVHKLKISIATPFPRTNLWNMVKDKLFSESYTLYDTDHLVYKHDTISTEEANHLKKLLTQNFYCNSKFKSRITDFLNLFPEFESTFKYYYSHFPFWDEFNKVFYNHETIKKNPNTTRKEITLGDRS